MKKGYLFSSLFLLTSLFASAQGLKKILKATTKDTARAAKVESVFQKIPSGAGSLSHEEIVMGLKEALNTGTQRASGKLSVADGFFRNAVIKILMPEEARKAEKSLRGLGMNRQVDAAILSMNRAAEDAAKSATPIFVEAVKGMSFTDALSILKGSENAATTYLKDKTTVSLTEAFRPVIENSLAKTGATRHWNTVFSAYNQFSREKINPDLAAYVTERALYGMFYQLAQEEQQIRKDPLARTSDILKKVFGSNSK